MVAVQGLLKYCGEWIYIQSIHYIIIVGVRNSEVVIRRGSTVLVLIKLIGFFDLNLLDTY